MDEHRIDRTARALSRATNRRNAIRILTGSAMGAAAIAIGANEAGAVRMCRSGGTSCRKGSDCCTGFCSPPDRFGRSRCGCADGAAPCDDWRCPVGPQVCCGAPSTPCSCFVAGTRIAMAEGTSKSIESLEFGDLVVGEFGSINRVIGIERPLLGDRQLYAINGSGHFVTAEHPFLSTTGWKSIDPAATVRENIMLPVEQLRVGDTVLQLVEARAMVLSGAGSVLDRMDISLAHMTVQRIRGIDADPQTPLFNLLLDGDHTYFANEFLVHNKL